MNGVANPNPTPALTALNYFIALFKKKKKKNQIGHAKTGMFSAFRNCVQILATSVRALSCCNIR